MVRKYVMTNNHKQKIALALEGNKNSLGRIQSGETKRKISEAKKRLYAEGKWIPWNKGLTKKTDSRLEKIARISSRPKSLEHRRKIGEAHRKLWANPEYRKKHSKAQSERTKLQWENPLFRKFMQDFMTEKWTEEEYRNKHSVFMKELWEDEKWKKRQMSAMLHGLLKKPTSLEMRFIKICQLYDLPFRYVGNGAFYIGSKNPDFIHRGGRKICVEVANIYEKHHPMNYERERKEYFAEFGWDCMVFQGNQLDETTILSELRGVSV